MHPYLLREIARQRQDLCRAARQYGLLAAFHSA
jgi:hypothetical protein